MTAKLNVSRRIRATPYTPRVESLGVTDYSVVNHTVLPKGFAQHTVNEQYFHLREHVQLWDVGCQRQVEVRGPDAAQLVQLMTPRDMTNARIGQCLYAPLIDDQARMLNDPIIQKLAEDHFWFSIADSDVLLWAKGLAVGMGLDVHVDEPDVWPLAIQGPKSDELASRVFGNEIRDIGFFKFKRLPFQGRELIVARTGYSTAGGFEIYLDDGSLGLALWDALWTAGQDLDVAPGCPNLIDRVEGGLLSYGNEMNRDNNPLECGFEKYCTLDGSVDYIGRAALQEIAKAGPQKMIRGVVFDGPPCTPCASTWPLTVDDKDAGFITTAIWSPGFKANVALGMVSRDYWSEGQEVKVHLPADGIPESKLAHGQVVALPFNHI